jgi:tetratricopeptide (TPR) repeat protein
VLELIQRKVEGEDITEAPAEAPQTQIIDLMEALKASLAKLRTAAELTRADVPVRRIGDALKRLRRELPEGRSLTELRIHASGDDVVVRDRSEPPWNPQSGQFHIEFEVRELATRVAPLARAAAARAHDDEPGRSAAEWFDLGMELEAVAPDEARKAYEHAIRLDESQSDARVNLGRMLHEAGLPDAAEKQYRDVLARGEHALAAYNLGVLLEDAGRGADAIQAYARSLAADPQLAEAHFNLARLYEERGDHRAALRHFNGYRALVRPT